jgi:uncharacterized protein
LPLQPVAGGAAVAETTNSLRRPAPIVTADNEFFWAAAASGRLVGQGCDGCGRLRHPPRPMCPHCGSLDWTATDLSGRGTVYSYAVVHHPQNPQFDYPVIAALVDLDEGIRLVTNLVGVAPGEVTIGQSVEVQFEATIDAMAVPVFRPTAAP